VIAESQSELPPESIAMPLSAPAGVNRREFLRRVLAPYFNDQPLVLGIRSCQSEVEYQTPDDVPVEDMPCPCGNPRHWLIKWQEIG